MQFHPAQEAIAVLTTLFQRLPLRQGYWTRGLTTVVLAASLAGGLVAPAQAASVGFASQSATHSTHLIAVRPMGGCPGVPVGC
jgi:hypothetical protein